jgi:methylthioribulose-1-phosphate dehydratase
MLASYLIARYTWSADNTVMLTLLLPRDAKSFRISHQEMIKGVRLGGHGKTLRFFDTLEVPIIENTADEEDLTSGMAEAMEKYPNAAAILVRRHGVYIWGESRPHEAGSSNEVDR